MITMNPVLTHGRSVWDQSAFPRDECEERLWQTQAEMAKRNIGGLVVAGTALHYGHLCFLTQHVPQANWSLAVVPAEGEATFITGVSGGRELPAMRARTWLTDVRNFRKLAPDLAQLLKEREVEGTVGLVGLDALNASIYEQILAGVSGLASVVADDLLDTVRRSPRSREVTAIRRAAEIARQARGALEQAYARGASHTAAMVEAERVARQLGALDVRGLVSQDESGHLMPVEAVTPYRASSLAAYLAVNHLGYWGDLAVTLGGGPLLDSARAALGAMVAAARPGARAGDLVAAAEQRIDPALVDAARLYGYGGGIGLSLGGPPALRPGSTEELVDGAALSVRVRLSDGAGAGAFVSDLVLVRRPGPRAYPGQEKSMLSEQAVGLDPVTLEVIRNALPAITNEMSYDLQRTSYNMMIYEVRDYCCALLDVEGRLVSQNIGGVSHFVADLGVVVKDGVEQYGRDGFAPGDVIITNHQRVAGQHLNNIVIYTPFFFRQELLGFIMVRAHWIDVGGSSTGFGAGGGITDPWQEGLQLDQIKLYEQGQPDNKVLKMIRDNIRFPDSSMGDLRSQIAACRLAERRLEELFGRYGRDTVLRSIETIFDESEAKCRAVVAQLPDGEFEAESWLDHDRVERESPVRIKVRVTIDGDDMTIDLTQCSEQRRGAMNSRTLAAAYIAYKAVTTPMEPVNEGSFRALKVLIQEGNMMMARYPALMAGWSMPLPTVVDTTLAALAPAMPDRIPAAHMGMLGGVLVFFGTDPRTGKGFVIQSIEGGGWGGRPWEDGESGCVSVCQGDVRNGPIESIELKCPVIVEQRELRQDSGGAGKYRGGLGVATRVRNLVEGRWNLTGGNGRALCPPWGLAGGKPVAISETMLERAGDTEYTSLEAPRLLVPPESRAIIMVAGGGGWGNPLDRDPALVRADVADELVSPRAAYDDYGVVVDSRTLEVDQAATAARRAALRATQA